MTAQRLDLDDFPDSPHADELRRGPRLSFAQPLEAAFVKAHLRRARPRARVWAPLTFALVVAFGIGQALEDDGLSPILLVHWLIVMPLVAALVWLAWSPSYERFYLPAARIGAPVLHVLAALFGAQAIARGAAEELAIVVLAMLCGFFFVGLLFRTALATCIAMLLAFAVGGAYSGIAHDLLLKCSALLAVACLLGIVIAMDGERSLRRRFLEEALLAELLDRDGLTQLKNRRAFEARLHAVWQQALREGRMLAFLFIDVDYFKCYNDEYGHQAGDDALRKVASVVRAYARRPLDVAARFGGEEFAVVMYGTELDFAAAGAEELRHRVETLAIEHRASECAPHVTVSIGVAVVMPEPARSPRGALQLADQALYRAKSAGRNTCVVHGSEEYRILRTGVYHNAKLAAGA